MRLRVSQNYWNSTPRVTAPQASIIPLSKAGWVLVISTTSLLNHLARPVCRCYRRLPLGEHRELPWQLLSQNNGQSLETKRVIP
jgi:hypothetical protein